MAITLADPYLKTARGKEHLDALRKELDTFYESKPYQFFGKFDVKDGRKVYQVACDVKPTPDRISLIAGDALYCLRSSLDQLVWCLASLTTGYPKGTQFPIFSAPDEKKFAGYTFGVPTDALKIIESLQPYNGRDPVAAEKHLLWRLNKLCIIDKHRRIPVHSSHVEFKIPAEILRHAKFDNEGVMTIFTDEFPLGYQVPSNPSVSFHVVFGDSYEGIQCDIDGIDQIHEFVTNNAIPRFAGFFK